MRVEKAENISLEKVKELLSSHNLPTSDLNEQRIEFYVIKREGNLVACAGIEKYGNIGLLRSVAVSKVVTRSGIGSKLIDAVIKEVSRSELTSLYLLTETAESFFSKKGFSRKEHVNAPKEIKKSSEFSEICSSSAVLMCKKLS